MAPHKSDLAAGLKPMQQRHFQTVATILRKLGEVKEIDYPTVVDLFASELEKTNPRFKRDRFIAACYAGVVFDTRLK